MIKVDCVSYMAKRFSSYLQKIGEGRYNSCCRRSVNKQVLSLTEEASYDNTGRSYHNGRCPDRRRHVGPLKQ